MKAGPQLKLWAYMIVAKTHDDMDESPRVPMIMGAVQKSQPISLMSLLVQQLLLPKCFLLLESQSPPPPLLERRLI